MSDDKRRTLTVQQERHFKALNILRAAAWQSFDRRRTYEWKIPFGLWTALAAFIGVLLSRPASESLPLSGFYPALFTGLFGGVLVGIHYYFLRGLFFGNDIDTDMSYYYRGLMWELLGIDFEKDMKPSLRHKKFKRKYNYSMVSQVGTTLLLVIAATVAMWVRTHLDVGQHNFVP